MRLNQLPVDYAGLALILLGLALHGGRGLRPRSGALGLGGLVAFVLGAMMLIDTEAPAYPSPGWSSVVAAASSSGAFLS